MSSFIFRTCLKGTSLGFWFVHIFLVYFLIFLANLVLPCNQDTAVTDAKRKLISFKVQSRLLWQTLDIFQAYKFQRKYKENSIKKSSFTLNYSNNVSGQLTWRSRSIMKLMGSIYIRIKTDVLILFIGPDARERADR